MMRSKKRSQSKRAFLPVRVAITHRVTGLILHCPRSALTSSDRMKVMTRNGILNVRETYSTGLADQAPEEHGSVQSGLA